MTDRVPTREELCLPTLRVLQRRGGSASVREISEDMAALLELPDAVREVVHGDGPRSEFDYQSAWARTYLKHMGAATNISRGVWSIAQYGRDLTAEADTAEADVQGRILEHIRSYRRSLLTRRARSAPAVEALGSIDDKPSRTGMVEQATGKDEVLALLREHKPVLAERFGVGELALFGSTVRDEAGPDSDIDILITLPGARGWSGYGGALRYLEGLFSRSIDLVVETEVRGELRPYIEADAVYV